MRLNLILFGNESFLKKRISAQITGSQAAVPLQVLHRHGDIMGKFQPGDFVSRSFYFLIGVAKEIKIKQHNDHNQHPGYGKYIACRVVLDWRQSGIRLL